MVKLVIYFDSQDNKQQVKNINIEDVVARHISELMLYKQNDLLKEYFSNLKDINGENHNVNFDKVVGFEFKQA